MAAKPSHGTDLSGASRLAIEAVAGVTELVEAVHMSVLNKAIGTPAIRPVAAVTSLVYRGVKGVTRLAGGGIDAVLGRLVPVLAGEPEWQGRAALVSALNGVLGDHLERSNNPLAIHMRLRVADAPVSGRILVLAHGLCMNDQQWLRDGVDHGAMLQRERGYCPVYLVYNSGRHVSDNGHELARQLQTLIDNWPVPVTELAFLCHSMGGLIARSACHYGALAGNSWVGLLQKVVFLGTPHHGAPLERGGNWVHLLTDMTPFSAPFSRLAKIRSAGITDLRHGSVLDEDWSGRDRFAHGEPMPLSLPLPPDVECFAVAATIGNSEGDVKDRLFASDGLVPLASAKGEHPDPARSLPLTHAVVFKTNHMQLLASTEVQALLLRWL